MKKPSRSAAAAPGLGTPHTEEPDSDLQWQVRADFYRYLDTANARVQAIIDDSETSLRGAITAVLQSGVTQAEVAVRIGVSRPTLSRWTNGEHIPRPIVRKAYIAEIKAYMKELTEDFRKTLRLPDDTRLPNGRLQGPAQRA